MEKTERLVIRCSKKTKEEWSRVLRAYKAVSHKVTAEDLLTEFLDYMKMRLKSQLRKLL